MKNRGRYALERHHAALNSCIAVMPNGRGWMHTQPGWARAERWMLAVRERYNRNGVNGRIARMFHDCVRIWQRKPNKFGANLIANRIKKEFNIQGGKNGTL